MHGRIFSLLIPSPLSLFRVIFLLSTDNVNLHSPRYYAGPFDDGAIEAFNRNLTIFSAGKSKINDINQVFVWVNEGVYSPSFFSVLFLFSKPCSYIDYIVQ